MELPAGMWRAASFTWSLWEAATCSLSLASSRRSSKLHTASSLPQTRRKGGEASSEVTSLPEAQVFHQWFSDFSAFPHLSICLFIFFLKMLFSLSHLSVGKREGIYLCLQSAIAISQNHWTKFIVKFASEERFGDEP